MALVWLALVLLVAATPASAATVQLVPASGQPGASATVVASQLPPESPVSLRVGHGRVQTFRASSAGVVTTRQVMPAAARDRVRVAMQAKEGSRAVLHYDVRSRWSPVASFASADLRGRAASVVTDLKVGRLLAVTSVTGLDPGARVAARYGGQRVARSTAGSGGRATLRALLPQDAPGRQFVVRGRNMRLTATLPTPPATVVAVGDIACEPPYETYEDHCEHAEVAELARSLDPDVIAIAGDVQYLDGKLREFRRSFDLSWGQLEVPLRPTSGNHEYRTEGAAGYYDYFEMQSGGWRPPPWYAYTVGYWRLYALNSNCEEGRVECGPDSEQDQWLRANLAAEPFKCTLAYWHHPRYSSGFHGSDPRTASMWRALDQAGAEVVVTGHDHHYERFALQDENGQPTDGGMREFVVGTGGSALSVVRDPRAPNTEYAQNREFGVLRLGLFGDRYTWRFIGLNGRTMDSGIGGCYD